MTRKRYLELAEIANEIVVALLEKGIDPDERCIVEELIETLWGIEMNIPGPGDVDIQGQLQ